jgi:L-asparaginase type I
MRNTITTSSSAHLRSVDLPVGLVLTGGTIGARTENFVVTLSAAHEGEAALVHELRSRRPDLIVGSPFRKLSENFEPGDWVDIASKIRQMVNEDDIGGAVVLHGTDTMTYTAAALGFLLSDVDIPIVLTGSNLPSGQSDSDASANINDAFLALPHLERGAYVAFAGGQDLPGYVYLGTRVRKLRTSKDAFSAINREAVGRIENKEYVPVLPYTEPRISQGTFAPRVDDRVLAFQLYPGLDLDVIFSVVANSDIRGVMIELYASATGPDSSPRFSVPEFIRRCLAQDVIVATTVDAPPNAVASKYETTLAIEQAGALYLRDMLPETAIVKLMWALAQGEDINAVRQLMLRPIAGEIDVAVQR